MIYVNVWSSIYTILPIWTCTYIQLCWWLSHGWFWKPDPSRRSRMGHFPAENVYSCSDSTSDPCCHPRPWMIHFHNLYCSGRLASSGQDCSMEHVLEKQVKYIIYSRGTNLFVPHACHFVYAACMTEDSKHCEVREYQCITHLVKMARPNFLE